MSPSNDLFPVLPDLGLYFVPKMSVLWLTDFFVQIPVLLTLVNVILLEPQPILYTIRIGNVLSMAYILRSTTMLVTSLPDPREGCQQITNAFWSTVVFHRCGDCIFSGHMTAMTVCLMYWLSHRAGSYSILGRVIVGGCILGGAWAMLASRAHYTVDLLVAVYLCVGLWLSHAYLWERYIKGRGRLLSLSNYYKPAPIVKYLCL